jgi:hypothetical protein
MPRQFQIAAARAAASYPVEVWLAMGLSEQCAAIYRELRKLDEESAKALYTDAAMPATQAVGLPRFWAEARDRVEAYRRVLCRSQPAGLAHLHGVSYLPAAAARRARLGLCVASEPVAGTQRHGLPARRTSLPRQDQPMPTRIVTYAFRRRHPPRKKKSAALAIPAIVKAPTKGERIRRREEADQAREVSSPDELADEARVADLIRRMMRPRDT